MRRKLLGLYGLHMLVLGFTCFSICCNWVVGAESVEPIILAWQQRQQQWQSVRFRFAGNVTLPKGFTIETVRTANQQVPYQHIPEPTATHVRPFEQELLLDLRSGRSRWHEKSEQRIMLEGESVWYPHEQTLFYDGNQSKRYKPKDKNHALGPFPQGTLATEFFINIPAVRAGYKVHQLPLLFACGIVPIGWPAADDPFERAFRPQMFSVVAVEEHEDRECYVLQTVPASDGVWREIWVDVDEPMRIYRYDNYRSQSDEPDDVFQELTATWRQTDDGPLPDRWTVFQHSYEDNGKVEVWNLQMTEFEANPVVSDGDFDMRPPPGTFVMDRTLPKGEQNYVVSAEGPNLPRDEVIAQRQSQASRNWLLYGLVAAGLALLLAGWLRHRQRTA